MVAVVVLLLVVCGGGCGGVGGCCGNGRWIWRTMGNPMRWLDGGLLMAVDGC
jgi:hypothetical protein